jgi:hypothetical protein
MRVRVVAPVMGMEKNEEAEGVKTCPNFQRMWASAADLIHYTRSWTMVTVLSS